MLSFDHSLRRNGVQVPQCVLRLTARVPEYATVHSNIIHPLWSVCKGPVSPTSVSKSLMTAFSAFHRLHGCNKCLKMVYRSDLLMSKCKSYSIKPVLHCQSACWRQSLNLPAIFMQDILAFSSWPLHYQASYLTFVTSRPSSAAEVNQD